MYILMHVMSHQIDSPCHSALSLGLSPTCRHAHTHTRPCPLTCLFPPSRPSVGCCPLCPWAICHRPLAHLHCPLPPSHSLVRLWLPSHANSPSPSCMPTPSHLALPLGAKLRLIALQSMSTREAWKDVTELEKEKMVEALTDEREARTRGVRNRGMAEITDV